MAGEDSPSGRIFFISIRSPTNNLFGKPDRKELCIYQPTQIFQKLKNLGGLAKEVGWASLPAALSRFLIRNRGGRSFWLKEATAQHFNQKTEIIILLSPKLNNDSFYLPIFGEVLKCLFSNFTLSFLTLSFLERKWKADILKHWFQGANFYKVQFSLL